MDRDVLTHQALNIVSAPAVTVVAIKDATYSV